MIEFRMPSLGADMEAATLVEQSKQPGERVERGEVIAVVETQKGAIEIEAHHSGPLERWLVPNGQKVPVGEVLALIRPDEEIAEQVPATPAPTSAAPAAGAALDAGSAPTAHPSTEQSVPAGRMPAEDEARRRISPAARRLAEREGVDLATVAAGADGAIGLAEVEAALAAARAAGPAAAAVERATGLNLAEMRRAIAAAMTRSKREIPHYYVGSTIDLEPLLGWLTAANTTRPPARRLLYLVPLLKACAHALADAPALNGHHLESGFVASADVHVGVAVALRGGGLIAPAIHDVARLDLEALMGKLDDLVRRVRGGRLRSSEMADPTITVSNLGDDTADVMLPVIYPPQVAIIGCGRIVERPWARQGQLSVCRTMHVTVAGDHRVSDARVAARFLRRLEELLADPERL